MWKKFKKLFTKTNEPVKSVVSVVPAVSLGEFEKAVAHVLLCHTQLEIERFINSLTPDIKAGKLDIDEVRVLHDLLKEQVLIIKSGFYQDKWVGLNYKDKKELINVSRKLVPKGKN